MVDYLRETHPDRRWEAIDLDRWVSYEVDVVICADVIEHVIDPQRLLDFIDECRFRHLVISTPARDLLYRPWAPRYWGPPRNRTHQREWTRREFRAFVGETFKVLDQRVVQFDQRTQMLVCLTRSGGRRPSLDDSLAKRRGRRLFRNA